MLVMMSACSSSKSGQEVPLGRDDARKANSGQLFGGDLFVFGGSKKFDPQHAGGLTVNPYLWKASLDVIKFMPIASADGSGGVIVTDWYQVPEHPGERLKVMVAIYDRQLRADAVKVTIYKQIRQNDMWLNATVDRQQAIEMEDLILLRARDLRIQSQKGSR